MVQDLLKKKLILVPKKISVNRQYTQLGSYAVVDDKKNHLNNLKDFSLYAFVYPTGTFGNSLNTQEKLKASGKGRQCIIGNWSVNETKGYALGINNEGHLEFWIGDGKIVEYVNVVPIVANFWFWLLQLIIQKTQSNHLSNWCTKSMEFS